MADIEEKIKIGKKQKELAKEINKHYVGFVKSCLKNYSLGKEYAYCAKIDLDNAKLLSHEKRKRHRYPLIIYLLQQSVEKYTKAYILLFGGVSKKQMRVIGHESGMSFAKALRNADLNKMLKKVGKIANIVYTEDTQKSLGEIRLEEAAKDVEEMVISGKIQEKEIEEILDGFDKVKTEFRKSLDTKGLFEEQVHGSFHPFIRPIMKMIYTPEKLDRQKEMAQIQFDILFFLYPLVFIMAGHENWTRYPKINKNTPLETRDYVIGKPLINKQIIRIIVNLEKTEKNLSTLRETLDNLSQLSEKELDKVFKRLQ